MAKGKLTKSELIEKQAQLKSEIVQLEDIIKASDTSTFEIIIDKIKSDMQSNIAEEDWKTLKQNQNKVQEFRKVSIIIQNQSELLEEKQDELEDVEWELSHYQASLFEQEESENTKQPTGFNHNDQELFTGDVFENSENELLLIFESNETKDKFAIIGLENESLLNYPKNREILIGCNYLGNAYEDAELQKKIEKYFTPEADASESEESEPDSEETEE